VASFKNLPQASTGPLRGISVALCTGRKEGVAKDGADTEEVRMERSSAMKQGLRLVATSVFLAAALLTTGCGENALMNPVNETVQDGGTVNAAKHDLNAAKHDLNAAHHDLNP
jgi:outer membrane murein-binding lipoprotein Lpp